MQIAAAMSNLTQPSLKVEVTTKFSENALFWRMCTSRRFTVEDHLVESLYCMHCCLLCDSAVIGRTGSCYKAPVLNVPDKAGARFILIDGAFH